MLLPEDQEKIMHSWCTFLKNFQEMNQSMASSYFEGMNKKMPVSPTLIGDVFIKAAQSLLKKPSVLMEAQEELLREINDLWQKMVFPEQDTAPANAADKRFHHEAWDNIPYFLFMKEYYLMTSRWLKNLTSQVEGIDELSKQKLQFYTNQLIEAASPTNFPLTNPEVLEEMVKTDGSSLKKGFQTLIEDMSNGQWMKMTDPTAFKLGETIATTKGDVVFRNELFELIHYHPLTEKQCSVPLLIIPQWINKFYIFDLSPKNSFVKWMLEQGQNVFIIYWVNPGSDLGSKTFENYLLEGAYRACEVVSTFTESLSLHTMGYCVGGNMLTALSAYLARTAAPFSLQTMTLLATIIDFTKMKSVFNGLKIPWVKKDF
jgi:polyhydroxyalkanoate synthase subunit PhaC